MADPDDEKKPLFWKLRAKVRLDGSILQTLRRCCREYSIIPVEIPKVTPFGAEELRTLLAHLTRWWTRGRELSAQQPALSQQISKLSTQVNKLKQKLKEVSGSSQNKANSLQEKENRAIDNAYSEEVIAKAKVAEERAITNYKHLRSTVPARTHRKEWNQLPGDYRKRIIRDATNLITSGWHIPINDFRDGQNASRHSKFYCIEL